MKKYSFNPSKTIPAACLSVLLWTGQLAAAGGQPASAGAALPPATENAIEKTAHLQEAGMLVAQGRTALTGGNYKLAAGIFAQALKLDPENLMAFYGLGAAALMSGNAKEAIPYFTRAAELNPSYWPAYTGRGKAFFDAGNIPAAETDLRKAVRINPGETRSRLILADILRTEGKGTEAATEYTAILDAIWQGRAAADQQDVMFSSATIGAVLSSRGEARLIAGDNPQAVNDFDAALEFTVQPAQALSGKGAALFNMGKFEESEVALSSAIALVKTNPYFYLARGNTRLALARAKDAENDFTAALDLNPGIAMAFANRAIARKAQSRPAEALKDFQAAIKLSPGTAALYSNRGNLYLAIGDAAKALKDYKEALRLAPGIPQSMSGAGAALVESGKYAEALKLLDQTIAAAPEYAPAYHNRAAARLEQGRYADALADIDKTLSIDRNDHSAEVLRGVILFNLGRWTEGSQAVMDGRKYLSQQATPDCALAFVDWTFNSARKPALRKLELCLSKGLYNKRMLVSPHQGGKFLKGLNKTKEYKELLKKYPLKTPEDTLRQAK